jgi:hypothetical protein
MKNIHLLPTKKPTGIFQSNSGLQFSIRDKVRVSPLIGFHIYITSDEEIKEGEKGWLLENNSITKNVCEFDCSNGLDGIYSTDKKIILTTDQDLIAEGVQSINNEFLEWFAQNPSCEFVEVDESKYFDGSHGEYIIIIPQEEHKQETLTYTEAAKKEERIFNSTMMSKQETLEEAMSKDGYYESDYDKIWREGVHFGAKWQAENMPIHIIDVENIHVHIENGVIIVEKNKKK